MRREHREPKRKQWQQELHWIDSILIVHMIHFSCFKFLLLLPQSHLFQLEIILKDIDVMESKKMQKKLNTQSHTNGNINLCWKHERTGKHNRRAIHSQLNPIQECNWNIPPLSIRIIFPPLMLSFRVNRDQMKQLSNHAQAFQFELT